MKISADKIVSALLRCATDHCDQTCPYYGGKYKCNDRLMLDAAHSIVHLISDNRALAADLEVEKLCAEYKAEQHVEEDL